VDISINKPAGDLANESTSHRFLKDSSPDHFSYLDFLVSLDDIQPAGGLIKSSFVRILPDIASKFIQAFIQRSVRVTGQTPNEEVYGSTEAQRYSFSTRHDALPEARIPDLKKVNKFSGGNHAKNNW